MSMKPAKVAHIRQKDIHVNRRFCWQRAGGMYLLYVELQRRLKPVKQSENINWRKWKGGGNAKVIFESCWSSNWQLVGGRRMSETHAKRQRQLCDAQVFFQRKLPHFPCAVPSQDAQRIGNLYQPIDHCAQAECDRCIISNIIKSQNCRFWGH